MIDKKRSLLNVIISIFFKVVLLFMNVFVRRFLVKYAGNDINGLNSLFLSIIGFLSVAELGVGSAITFCMYKPIIDGDNAKVSALYRLFKKVYIVITIIILVSGLAICPFLRFLAKSYETLDTNIYLSFILMLVSVLVTYLFCSKTSLINAYKNNYVTTTINSVGLIIQYVLQIVVLVLTRSFYYYLVCRIISALIQWCATEIICRIKYKTILESRNNVDQETKKVVKQRVFAMFLHKVGGAMVNSADSIIISTFIGLSILGKYSNYIVIISAMVGILNLFFTPLTSVIGHLCAKEKRTNKIKYFNFFYGINYIFGCVCFLGYFAVIDDLISILFGTQYLMDAVTKAIVAINYFIQFLRQSVLLFRDATGTFYNDRFKPILESALNVVLSIAFVFAFGVAGVLVATIITNVLVCHVIEPHVLFKYGFDSKQDGTKYIIENYFYICLFVASLIPLSYISFSMENLYLDLLLKGIVSFVFSLTPSFVFVFSNKGCFTFLHRKNTIV